MDTVIYIIGLVVAYFVGTKWLEKKHYASIEQREKEYLSFPLLSIEQLDANSASESWVVSGSTVVSIDMFKKFIAGLVNFIGGRVVTYETLIDRARRESILRMIERAKNEGGQAILNMRIETSSISKNAKNNVGAVEVLVYGTAVKLK